MTNPTDSVHPFNETNESNSVSIGLTKREYFAAMAMQGILANHWCQNHYETKIDALGWNDAAKQSVLYADALIKELNK